MVMVVHITIEEYDYLINNLLKEYQEFLLKIKVVKRGQHFIDIFLDEIVADEIRELSGDEVGSHFDENYMPTKEGCILENFIDKFYTG